MTEKRRRQPWGLLRLSLWKPRNNERGRIVKFKNVAICDLRAYNSPEAAGSIESIQNVAMLVLPKNPDAETQKAMAQISRENVACTIQADEDTPVLCCNGQTTLSDNAFPPGDSILVVNGKAVLQPISEGKCVSMVVNGNVVYDSASIGRVHILVVNGSAEGVDFSNTEFLQGNTVLSANRFSQDGENQYYSEGVAVLQAVPPHAHGKIYADIVVADPSVRESAVRLEAKNVFYSDTNQPILFKSRVQDLRLSETFLEEVSGKLVLSEINTLYIEKNVTPELFREKVLLICNVNVLRAPKAMQDVAQIVSCTVNTWRRR